MQKHAITKIGPNKIPIDRPSDRSSSFWVVLSVITIGVLQETFFCKRKKKYCYRFNMLFTRLPLSLSLFIFSKNWSVLLRHDLNDKQKNGDDKGTI
jgi:hypothetical protein